MVLSIVIVNWNSKDFVRKCVLSLRKYCSDLDPQIIVVDGGSFDGCDTMLTEEFPEVEFVQSQENVGFGRANNLGAKKATGEALLLLNPDTEVFEGSIQALLDSLQSLDKVGIVGARQLNTDGSLQLSSIHQLPKPWQYAFTTSRSHKQYWESSQALNASKTVVVEAISGACMMMRLELFQKVGGFSPEYFMYVEDMDLCFKVTNLGYKCYHNPNAIITHHGGGSTEPSEGVSRFSTVMMREALCIFFERQEGFMAIFQFRMASFFSAVLRILVCTLALIFKNQDSKKKLQVARKKWWIIFRWSLMLETKFIKSITINSSLQ